MPTVLVTSFFRWRLLWAARTLAITFEINMSGNLLQRFSESPRSHASEHFPASGRHSNHHALVYLLDLQCHVVAPELVSLAFAMCRSQRRLHDGHCIPL